MPRRLLTGLILNLNSPNLAHFITHKNMSINMKYLNVIFYWSGSSTSTSGGLSSNVLNSKKCVGLCTSE
jgi:hypothetical protein